MKKKYYQKEVLKERNRAWVCRIWEVDLFGLKIPSIEDFIIHIPVFDVVIYCKSYTVKKNTELTSQDCQIL